MRWRIPIVVLLALFVAVSCDQQPVSPTDDQVVAESPPFNFTNNYGWHGKTFRTTRAYGWLASDEGRDLIAQMATYPYRCGLNDFVGPVTDQEVQNNPDLADEIYHALVKGELSVELYDWTGNWAPFDCANWTADRYMGTGRCKLIYTDNDVDAWLGGHPNNNSFGVKCTGKVELDDGSMTNFNYHFKETWKSGKPNSNIIETLKISNDPR
jgi:hypothetical protein